MNAFRHRGQTQQQVDDLPEMPLVLSADRAVVNMGTGFLHAWKSKERCLPALFLNYSVRHCDVSEDQGRVFLPAVSLV